MTLQRLLDRFDLLMDTPDSVSKLRQFILDHAIRGNLSERDQSDTPADELLEEIQAEKQRLYEKGEIRKPKTFSSVPEEEIPFSVPAQWEWAYLGKTGRWGAGSTPKRSNSDYWDDGSIPWLKIGDLNNARVGEAEERITEQALDECTFKANQPGDVAIGMYGSIGKLGILEIKCVTNQAICVCTPMGGISSRFLFYYLRTARKTFEDLGAGGAQQNISKTKIVNTPLPLPPLEEQQRIVETVDRLMDECDTLEQRQRRAQELQVQVGSAATEALQSADDAEELRPAWERVREHFDTVTGTPEGVDALRQTILQLAVQGRLTERDPDDTPASESIQKSCAEIQKLYEDGKITKPSERPPVQEEEKIFDVPKGWTWTRLGNVLALVNGRAYKQEELLDEGTPVIRIQNLTGNGSWYYTDLDLPAEKYCNSGDLLYTWSGTFGPHIWDGERAVFHYHIWRIELTEALTKRYAYHLLKAISADVEDDAHGIMLPHMTKGGMEKHPIPLPPLQEQNRIVQTLDRLIPLFGSLKSSLANLSKRGEKLLETGLRDVNTDRSVSSSPANAIETAP